MPASGDWLPFEQARLVVISQNFKRSQDFKDWSDRPPNIPSNPRSAYTQDWRGWAYFLGIGSASVTSQLQ